MPAAAGKAGEKEQGVESVTVATDAPLTEWVRQESILQERLDLLTAEYEKAEKGLRAEIAEARRQRQMAAADLDLARIQLGEHIVMTYNRPWRWIGQEERYAEHPSSERVACVRDAIRELATDGGGRLHERSFGTKDYDRFADQREDHSYGMGPKHGHIVFSVGLQPEARGRELTPEEIEAAIYLLEAFLAGTYVSPKEAART